MTTPDIQSLVESVLPCPCCGAAASLDRHRSFRLFETGEVSEGISISCCECPVEMMLCREDIQQTDDTIIAYLVRKWNARVESTDLTRLRAELAEEKRKVEELGSVIYIRCTGCLSVPQQNSTEFTGGECGGCIAKERDKFRSALQRIASMSVLASSEMWQEEALAALTPSEKGEL